MDKEREFFLDRLYALISSTQMGAKMDRDYMAKHQLLYETKANSNKIDNIKIYKDNVSGHIVVLQGRSKKIYPKMQNNNKEKNIKVLPIDMHLGVFSIENGHIAIVSEEGYGKLYQPNGVDTIYFGDIDVNTIDYLIFTGPNKKVIKIHFKDRANNPAVTANFSKKQNGYMIENIVTQK